VHARLLINGAFVGLFALVEQIDGRFTRSRFSEGGEGNLYKEAWPLTSQRVPIDDATLRPTLETNQDENASLATMLAFGQALAPADLATLPQVLAQFTDLDYAMRYVAIDRTIAHDDGPFHWYCGTTACTNHNYYWYEERTAARLWLIAWDLDNGFNLDNVTTTLWIAWDDTAFDCMPRTQPPYNLPLRAPACDKVVLGWASLQEVYLAKVGELLNGPLRPDAVESKLLAWESQIGPVVEEAARTHSDAVPVVQWEQARSDLRAAIETLRARAVTRLQRGAIAIRDPWM
jgi:hypothetical protein